MAHQTYTSTGVKAQTAYKLPKELFAVEIKNHQLLKDAYLAYLANGRDNYAKTLKRGQVSGGGAKPWRQKGTGRARVGSSRTPVWRGGGIVFGPSGNENYSRKLNIKAKKQALAQALSLSADKKLIVIDEFIVKDGKTKSAVKLLDKLSVSGNVLIVTDTSEENTLRALNNLNKTSFITATKVNVPQILDSDSLIITKKAIDILKVRIGGKQ